MYRIKRLSISGVVLAALLVLVVSCGSQDPEPQPTSTPFDADQLRSMIQDAVSESVPADSSDPGLTGEQLRSLVEEAMQDSVQPGLSAEEIEQLIQTAIESATVSGVTLEEVREAIAAALSAETARMNQAGEESTGPLVVYSGRSKSLVDAIIGQFSQATGVKVEVKYAGTSQLAATLLEEGDNSRLTSSLPRTLAGWARWRKCWPSFRTGF